jgi:hypothetical protein
VIALMKFTALEIVFAIIFGLVLVALVWLYVLMAHAGVLLGWD